MRTQPIALMLSASVTMHLVSFAGAQELSWPEQAEARIEAVLEIKREAMRLPGMRSRSKTEFGVLGKQAEALMDELAVLVADPAFVRELEKAETRDVRAKIALWAMDRKKRPEEYARFEKWYVNRPSNEEAIDYFYRPHANRVRPEFLPPKAPGDYVPRPGTWRPHNIDEKDRTESSRPILEYCFFIPPTGRGFDEDEYRLYIMGALIGLGDLDRSMVVFFDDADIFASSATPLLGGLDTDRVSQSILALVSLPEERSFHVMARLWAIPGCRGDLEAWVRRLWKGHFREILLHLELKANHDKWMELADRDWSEPHEKEFAEWLKTVPAPTPPPPVNPNNPFGTFDEVE